MEVDDPIHDEPEVEGVQPSEEQNAKKEEQEDPEEDPEEEPIKEREGVDKSP